MQKTTKSAIATGTAAILLLGGGASLAYWSDAATGAAGSITTGSLGLASGSCDSTWKYAAGNANAGNTVTKIVPGDSITKNCTFTINASGDNLKATPDLPSSTSYKITSPATAPASQKLNVTGSYTVGTTALASGSNITSADNGKTLTAKITVQMPFGDATTINANDTKNMTASLNALKVTLTQAS